MSVNSVGFELYGKNYGLDNNTNGSRRIQDIQQSIFDKIAQKQGAQDEVQQAQQPIQAEDNKQEQAQVTEISNNLAQIEAEYSTAVSAASSAQAAASTAAANASNLEAAAAALPETISQGLDESGIPIMIPNPAKAAAEAAAKAAREEATGLQEEANKMIEVAQELQTYCNELQAAFGEVQNEQDDGEEEDVELQALYAQIEEFDAEIEELNSQLEQAQAEKVQAEQDSVETSDGTNSIEYNGENNRKITKPDGTVIETTTDDNGNTVITSTDPDGTKTTNTICENGENGYAIIINSVDSNENNIFNQTIVPNEDVSASYILNGYSVKYQNGEITSYETTDLATGIKTMVNNKNGEITYYDENGNELSISDVQEQKLRYDRSNANRDTIINHNPINIINGLQDEQEQNVQGYQLDLDVYYDQYHLDYNKLDENSFNVYLDAVSGAITNDIARYAGIDIPETGKIPYDELMDAYQTIASNNNITITEAESNEDYINQVNQELAKRSWDGTLDGDYVDLSGIARTKTSTAEVGQVEDIQETTAGQEAEEAQEAEENLVEVIPNLGSSQNEFVLASTMQKLHKAIPSNPEGIRETLMDDNLTAENVVDIIQQYQTDTDGGSLVDVADRLIGDGKNEIMERLADSLNEVAAQEIAAGADGSSDDQMLVVGLICRELYNATAADLGTADEFVINMLNRADDDVLLAVIDQYGNANDGRNIYDDIRNDFSGNAEFALITRLESVDQANETQVADEAMFTDQALENILNELHGALDSSNASDQQYIINILDQLSPEDLVSVMEGYNNGEHTESFVQRLDNKYGSNGREQVMSVITNKLVQAACVSDNGYNTAAVNLICDELYNSTAGKLGTSDEFVIGIIEQASPRVLTKILDSYKGREGLDLIDDIQNDFSGSIERILVSKLKHSYKKTWGREYCSRNNS